MTPDDIRKASQEGAPSSAFEIYPELRPAIKAMIQHAIGEQLTLLRRWLIGAAASVILTSTGSAFFIGQLYLEFRQTQNFIQENETALNNRASWMYRKDALDDDVIRYLVENENYRPPAWYQGRDADQTGN